MTPFSEAFSNKGVLEIVAPCLFKKSIVLSSPPKEEQDCNQKLQLNPIRENTLHTHIIDQLNIYHQAGRLRKFLTMLPPSNICNTKATKWSSSTNKHVFLNI